MTKRKRGKRGFTLVELLVVIAIIAVLIAIAVPVYTTHLESARKATDTANARSANSIASATYLMYSGKGEVAFKFGLDTHGNMGIQSVSDGLTGFSADGDFSIDLLGESDDYCNVQLAVKVKGGKVTANSWAKLLGAAADDIIA